MTAAFFAVLCLFVGCSIAASWNFAGTTTGATGMIVYPTITAASGTANAQTCAAGTAAAVPYVSFNFTVNTTNAFWASMLAEKVFTNPSILLYSTAFDAANPCTNFKISSQTRFNVLHELAWVAQSAGLYFVVITSTGTGSGLFAIRTKTADAWGTTNNVTGPWWSTPYDVDDCSADVADVAYSSVWWTAPTTGYYRFRAVIQNPSYNMMATWYNVLAVYQDHFPNTTLAAGTVADPCGDGWFIDAVGGEYGDNQDSFADTVVAVTAGWNYTIVVSAADPGQIGTWGLFADAFTFVDLDSSVAIYDAPDVPAFGTDTVCVIEELKQWASVFFTAQYQTYIIDTPAGGGWSLSDAMSVLYWGHRGNASNPPSPTCDGFIIAGDTGDGGALAYSGFVPGMNYTVVVCGYSGGSGTQPVVIYGGQPLGPFIPPPTSTSAASGTGTSNGASTNGASTGAKSSTTKSSSSASAVFVSSAVLAASVLFALL